VKIEFAPRPDFGRVETRLVPREGGLALEDSHDPVVLRSPGIKWEICQQGRHTMACAEIELTGEPKPLTLCYGTGSLRDGSLPVRESLRLTVKFWKDWAHRLQLPSIETDLVRHSALVLKALCFGPTGAISAAATTSLPEHLGGVRNWDYRFCWLRDAAMSAAALVKLGSDVEAMHFLGWLLGVLRNNEPDRLHPLYSVLGEELGSEAEITDLPGYAGSRPVRVGNAAARQVQLDVFGPIVELIARLIERDAPLSTDHWRLVDAMVQGVSRRWQEPDHGIWEIRKPGRHHVHSKVMCWQTVDRAVKIAERFYDRPQPQWADLRDRIAKDVLDHGFNKKLNAFTSAYENDEIDSAALAVGFSGLISHEDPRFLGTVKAVEKELLEGPVVYRYRFDDGLPGAEGGFHICTSWLIDCYIRLGRIDDARRLFDRMIALVGPTGMMSEQYDPRIRRALGNHPQAYSHIGIIENAIALAKANETTNVDDPPRREHE
jgi:GH15 family glucan-1,4-alpha-glucosidase